MSFWDRLVEQLKDIGSSIGNWTPKILGALIIFLIGRWIAKIIRRIVKRLMEKPAATALFDRAGIGEAMKSAGYSPAVLVSNIVYAFLLLVTLLLTAEALGIQSVIDLLERLVAFLPQVIVAVFIVIVAVAIGNFLGDMVKPWGETRNVPWLHYATRFALVIFGIVTAMEVLEIGYAARRVLEFSLGAAAVAFAISFGIGGIDTAKKWWGKYLTPGSDQHG